MREILIEIAKEARGGEKHSRLAQRGLVYELLALILRDADDAESEPEVREYSVRHYALVEPALRRIRDGYRERMTVEELAGLCSVSKYHFCRVFKAVTGVTVMQYVNDYRLNIADTLLKNTDKSVGEVAWMCGFEDAGYFSRIYKKKFSRPAGKRKSKNSTM
jgi:transcriptional regulator GlxA family with amidase domain